MTGTIAIEDSKPQQPVGESLLIILPSTWAHEHNTVDAVVADQIHKRTIGTKSGGLITRAHFLESRKNSPGKETLAIINGTIDGRLFLP